MNKDVKYYTINAVISLGVSFFNSLIMAEQGSYTIPALISVAAFIFVGSRELKAAFILKNEQEERNHYERDRFTNN